MREHIIYMDRCIDLATHGEGLVHPNPMVGSVIVSGGRIIGEGYHHCYGGAHAEVEAIRSVKDASALRDSTLYVNLEPCSHHGKTPPCSDLIVASGIPRVVIGALDSNPKVAGKGIERLRSAGIEVITGVEARASRWINRNFFTFHERQRPYILLKWAATEDGFIDIARNETFKPEIHWITDTKLRRLVHRWRSDTGAIVVGANTVINDNPELTTRYWPGRNPLRVVLDPEGRLTTAHKVFDAQSQTWVYTSDPRPYEGHPDVIVKRVPGTLKALPQQIIRDLYMHGIQSVTIEGGKVTLDSFIRQGLWDEARIFTGAKRFGHGTKAPDIQGSEMARFGLGSDLLRICFNSENLSAWEH